MKVYELNTKIISNQSKTIYLEKQAQDNAPSLLPPIAYIIRGKKKKKNPHVLKTPCYFDGILETKSKIIRFKHSFINVLQCQQTGAIY